jgi:3-oxoacyl-[acyl-carrier-protein] synthase II
MILPNMAAANISRIFGFKGFSSTVVTACAASTQSIGDAAQLINNGLCDVVLAGGCEAGVSKLGLGGFSALRALSTNNDNPEKASRPFDLLRDGFVPAEGAGILILESEKHALKRNANILCEIIGMGVSSDAYHPVQPDPEGTGAILAMKRAIKNANINIEDIDYINAHGTSTPLNDACETLAIKKTFKELACDIPISSTKSMIGHALGGAGALEAIATILSIINQKAPPTINLENPDPECDLNYIPNKAQDIKIKHAMSNNFGFGGQNASIIIKKID